MISWKTQSCYDEPYEIDYFEKLIGFLDGIVLPKRKWEEKYNMTEKEKETCLKNKLSCKFDIYHCGMKYKQIILGRLNYTKCFINCPNYEVLNISDWSIDKNDLFIKYITSQPKQTININLPICPIFPIRIYFMDIPTHDIIEEKNKLRLLDRISTKIIPGSVTARELCLLVHMKLKFYVIQKENGDYEDFILVSKLLLKDIKKNKRYADIPIRKLSI
jgi:hypothetical protein